LKRGIFTFTPNPVLDLGGVVEKVIPDEKVYVEKETRSPGGNGINAARVIHRLGLPVTLTGFLGGGVGMELGELLKKEKLQQKFIPIQQDTRIGITVSTLTTGTQTRLSFRGPRIRASEKQALFRFFKNLPAHSLVIVGGSLPLGFAVSDLRALLRIGHQRKVPVIIDCPGKILKSLVRSRPLLIKPNLLEFQELTGSSAKKIQSVLKEARKLNKYIPLVCISSVEGGALLVSADGAWFGRIPKVKINSVVGAGDSMVGAMTAHLWRYGMTDLGTMLRWGLAASCASLSHRGTELGQASEIRKYFKKTIVKEIEDTSV
jgi:1-phosphofructokinase family hexose kinase